jgi:hypothetical protein
MNFLNKRFLIILFSFLSIWLVGCVDLPTSFKAPQWDVDLNLPLVNRSYTLNDIIKKQKYISVQGTSSADSIYVLQSDNYFQSTGISKFIRLTAQTSSQGNVIPVGISGSSTFYLPFPEGAEPVNAVFTSGLLAFHIVNPNQEDISLNVVFPGILQNGTELSIPITVRALQEDSIQTSLSGYVYNLPANQKSNSGSIQALVSVLPSSLSILSSATLDFYCSGFSFSSVTGYLPQKSLGTFSQSFPLNLGNTLDYRNKASLKYSKIDMEVKYSPPNSNHFGIQMKNLNITGMREDGSRMTLEDSTGSSNLTFDIEDDSTHLTFTQINSNITSFIAFMPSKIELNTEYIMNPGNITGSATNQDSLQFTTNFSTNSILALQRSLISDTMSLNFSDKDTLKIRDAESAYINVNVENGIPLDSWLTIVFTDGDYKPLFALNNSSGSDSIYLASANVNSAGEVVNPVTTNNLIQLDSNQTPKLARARYIIYSVAAQTTGVSNGLMPYVVIRPNDLIKINVYGGVKYNINIDDLK